jgi:nicotinate-nucleotide adenylyltransferase
MLGSNGDKRRIGVLGGSFDPVHIGHLIIAQDAIERLELAELIFVPAAIPPHKQHLQQVDAEHRLNMLRLATESDIRLSVADLEIQRGGVSYTLETLAELQRMHREAQLCLIIGSDTLVELHTWWKADEIIERCEVCTLIRPGDDQVDQIAAQLQFEDAVKERLMANLVEAHPIDISSTEIRMRIAEGLSIRYLVPSEVEMYICEHGLYQG